MTFDQPRTKTKQIKNESESCEDNSIKNDLIENLDKFYLQSSFNKLKLNKIVESAIHWSLVNGR